MNKGPDCDYDKLNISVLICETGIPRKIVIFHTKYPKQQFRRVYRTEIAMGELCLKEKVMNTRTKDSKIVHVLINRQRQSIRGYIHDLNIDNEVMSGKQDIINGFRKHFSNLAVPIFDGVRPIIRQSDSPTVR
jgi:hypothetical protein